jgi:hypothetical protein
MNKPLPLPIISLFNPQEIEENPPPEIEIN